MPFDPRGDFELLVDGLATVTYEPPHQDGSAWPVQVVKALRRAVSRREIEASNGLALNSDTRWHVSCLILTGEPRIGGVIVEADDTRWTILDVARETLGSRWAMNCRNMAIVYDLNAIATIEKATYAKAAGGAVEPTWSAVARIRARVQPQSSTITVDADQPISTTTHRIILEREFSFDAGADIGRDYRVTACDSAGVSRIYKLTGYERSEQVGQLPVLLAIETPRPME